MKIVNQKVETAERAIDMKNDKIRELTTMAMQIGWALAAILTERATLKSAEIAGVSLKREFNRLSPYLHAAVKAHGASVSYDTSQKSSYPFLDNLKQTRPQWVRGNSDAERDAVALLHWVAEQTELLKEERAKECANLDRHLKARRWLQGEGA